MARITKIKNLIKYQDDNDTKSRFIDLPEVISDDYSFQMMFGYTYPSLNYNASSGIISRLFKGTIKDSYYKNDTQ